MGTLCSVCWCKNTSKYVSKDRKLSNICSFAIPKLRKTDCYGHILPTASSFSYKCKIMCLKCLSHDMKPFLFCGIWDKADYKS